MKTWEKGIVLGKVPLLPLFFVFCIISIFAVFLKLTGPWEE
jgi:hypothetical protein